MEHPAAPDKSKVVSIRKPPAKVRPWREIAEEIQDEPDPGKMLDLIVELNEALKYQRAEKRAA